MNLAKSVSRNFPPQIRQMRHLRAVIQHGTPRKWTNLIRVETERKLRRIKLKGLPYLMFIDPCNYCDLRCPLCPTGLGTLERSQAFLPFEKFKQYFDQQSDYLFEIYLYHWGEPLLNKQVFNMIQYAQSRNVGTNISSNLSATTSSDIDHLLDSGLEYLVVSLDGTSAESYSKYRVRGDYERVVANMNEILCRRKLRGQRTPFVEWQFIVMKQNEHEIPEAERMAKQIGVDLLRFTRVGMPHDTTDRKVVGSEWFPITARGMEYALPDDLADHFGIVQRRSPCFYLYRSMYVSPDGGVAPCCASYKKESDFAQLPAAEIRALWNNEIYQYARSLFSQKKAPGEMKNVICDTCKLFEKYDKPFYSVLPSSSVVRQLKKIANR